MTDARGSTKVIDELRALGTLCRAQGDLIRAEQHFRLALNLYETSFPDRHVDAMVCLLGLVQILETQGKTNEARELETRIPTMNARRRGS